MCLVRGSWVYLSAKVFVAAVNFGWVCLHVLKKMYISSFCTLRRVPSSLIALSFSGVCLFFRKGYDFF